MSRVRPRFSFTCVFGAHPFDRVTEAVVERHRLNIGKQRLEASVVGLAVRDVALAILDVVALDRLAEKPFEQIESVEQ